MSSGKSGGNSKDYYGHCAGIVCQGRLDFIWGLFINNELAWPKAKKWDSQIYKQGTSVIYTDGNVYRASQRTEVDPPNFPWVLQAVPWVAGSYDEDDVVLHNGHLWESTVNANVAEPPTDPPSAINGAILYGNIPVIDGWRYLSTPQEWNSGDNFWPANSIVAHNGRLYTTPSGTKAEPPASPWVLWKVDRASSGNPLKITVEDYGDAYLYWGTADQVLDGSDEAILAALGHPPYRHRAVLVLKNFFFGTMQASAPDVVVLGGRAPEQSLITGDAALLDDDWQANPWCVLAELLTHPVYGLGLPASWFDAESWQEEADHCLANHALTYISPMYTSVQKVRDLVADLLGYPDAFIFWSTVATLVAGHWPHAEAAPAFTAANTIDRNDLVEEISWGSDGWGSTADSVTVAISDVQAGFKTRPIAAANLFNRTINRRVQGQKIDRPHITRLAQGASWAAEYAKIAGEQFTKGTLTVRAEKATAITPGTIFLLTDDALQVSHVVRCISKTIAAPPNSGHVRIAFELERGVSPQPYSPTPENPEPEQGPAPAPILSAQIFQLPAGLGTGPFQVGLLAQRENEHTTGCQLWFQQADATAFQLLGVQPAFAVAGMVDHTSGPQIFIPNVTQGETYEIGVPDIYRLRTVNSFDPGDPLETLETAQEGVDYLYDPLAGTITILAGGNIDNGYTVMVWPVTDFRILISSTALPEDIEAISTTQTRDEAYDNKLLMILFHADDQSKFEILSVKSMEMSGSFHSFKAIGGRYGTLRGGGGADWSQGDRCFIIPRASIAPFEHEAFAGLQEAGSTAAFRLAPSSAWVQADITDLYDPAANPAGLTTQIAYNFSDPFRPTATWEILKADGVDIADFTVAFEPDTVFDFTWQIQDLNADLTSAQLVARLGALETVLWSQSLEGTDIVRATQFSLATEGDYDVVLIVTDASGRVTEFPLTAVGETAPVTLRIAPAASTKVANPTMTTENQLRHRIVTMACATAGATIEYQVVDLFDPPGGSWTTYTGPFPVLNDHTLHARASKAGMTTSSTVTWHFRRTRSR